METKTTSVNEEESKLMVQLVKDWIDYLEDLMEDFPKLYEELSIAQGLINKISDDTIEENKESKKMKDVKFREALLKETHTRIGQAGCTSGDCD